MPEARFTLLGGGSLFSGERRVERLERKSAALVAYLALSGATVRTRIAGLLWPESRERTARNNLAQVVKRLRDAAGTSVIEGTTTLALVPGVEVDVARLELLAQRGHHGDVADSRGILLDGFDYDDCSELDTWLTSQRERLRRAVKRARTAEAARLEREGRFDEALTRSRTDLEADPLDEETARRRMRLLYRAGDAAEALRTFEELRSKLDTELGAKPHAETAALAASIRAGAGEIAEERPPPSSRMSTPLVGRADDWKKLENVWSRRGGVLVVGASGIGKSRLVREFATSKGVTSELGGRPGDSGVPYATIARFFRQIVDRYERTLPLWARTELARLVPSLGAAPDGNIDKLRFFEALTEALRIAVTNGMSILVLDDLQFIDAASLEALEHVLSGFWSGETKGLRTILAARKSMDAELDARLRRAESAGLLVRVVLEPLDETSTKALLVGEPALLEHVAEVHAISGGNPFFVLEIVKGVRSKELDPTTSLAKGRRAIELVAQRLEPLSAAAWRVLRVAAVAGTSFDLELAANVLEMPALDLVEPLAELAEAQVLESLRFTHDLLQEIAVSQMPAAVREFIHARVAEYLVARGDEPARAAQHWLAAGKPAEAAPLYVLAGDRAQQISRLSDAGEFYEKAAELFEAQGERSRAFRAIGELRRIVRHVRGAKGAWVVERLEALATTDAERARALLARGGLLVVSGHLREAEKIVEPVSALAEHDPWVDLELHQFRFWSSTMENDLDRAERERSETARAVARVEHYELGAVPLWFAAEISRQRDLFREALSRYETTVRDAESRVKRHWARGRFFAYEARCQMALGDVERARASLAEAADNVGHFEKGSVSLLEVHGIRSRFEIATGELQSAAELAASLVADVPKGSENVITRATGFHRLALIAATAGRTADFEHLLGRATKEAKGLPWVHARTLLVKSIGGATKAELQHVQKYGTPLDGVRATMRATKRPPKAALAACEAAANAIEAHEARGYLAEAVARRAAAKVGVKDRKGALADVELARTLADTHALVDFSRGLFDALVADVLEAAKANGAVDRARAEEWKKRAAAALDAAEKA